MHADIRERARSEGGFTLIELLVVMIIIAILMAVAVPTFLSQKNTALKTQATANIKQVINAMESCSTAITAGGYKETGGLDCSLAATLTAQEASLGQLNIQQTAPAASEAGTKQTHVQLDSTSQGFIVQKVINDSGQWVYFAEVHTAAGQIYKLCGTTAFSPTSTSSAVVDASKTCKKPGSATAMAW